MFQAGMSCFTLFYVGIPDGQTLYSVTAAEKQKLGGKNGERWQFLAEMLENQTLGSGISTQVCSLPLTQGMVCGYCSFAKLQ